MTASQNTANLVEGLPFYRSTDLLYALPAIAENRDQIIAWGYPYDSIMGPGLVIVFNPQQGMVVAAIGESDFADKFELVPTE